MSNIAFIFPGQGAQTSGMGEDLYNNFDAAKHVFETADKVLQKSVSGICFKGTDEELKQTINTQSALLTVSIAALEALKSKIDITPKFLAGHSLGEYAALYAAGVLNLENVLLAIQKRSDLMHKATLGDKNGAMCAVIGPSADVVEDILRKAQEKGIVSIANYNSPAQTVITGESTAVEYAGELLKAHGAKRVIPLSVSGAFHSALMEGASGEFEAFVDALQLNDAKIPVITNVDSQITMQAQDFRKKMPQQISSSVLWTQTIEKMVNEGVTTFVELGNGNVLAGLNKRICPEAKTYNVFDTQSLNNTIEELKA
jgi:[acyl-carrier-protein] S-malonyltransferase